MGERENVQCRISENFAPFWKAFASGPGENKIMFGQRTCKAIYAAGGNFRVKETIFRSARLSIQIWYYSRSHKGLRDSVVRAVEVLQRTLG